MKLTWPLWIIVTIWLVLHGVGFFSLALGWLVNLGFAGGLLVYAIYGAIAQMIAYRIIVNKAVVQEWKSKIKDTSAPYQSGAQTKNGRGWGFLFWLLLPTVLYGIFFYMAIGEK